MFIKVFLLGRPGSGKSAVAQLLETISRENGWDTKHIYDYKYLHGMFRQEVVDNIPKDERSFRQKGPDACQGFDVVKFDVLDTALKQMAHEIKAEEHGCLGANKLLVIEFARKEYSHALDIFGYEILKDAHLLYVKLDLKDCIKRVQKRADVHRLRSEYDHFVSEDIMRSYYGGDDWSDKQFFKYLNHLRSVGVTDEELDNSGTDQELESQVRVIFGKLVSPQLRLYHRHVLLV